jgi:hypothetical protein
MEVILNGVIQYPFLINNNSWTGTNIFKGQSTFYGENVKLTSTSAATYTVLSSDNVILATGGAGGIAVDLPVATGSGRKLMIIKIDGGAGAVTVTPNSTLPDTIEGNSTVSLASQYSKTGLIDVATGLWADLAKEGV